MKFGRVFLKNVWSYVDPKMAQDSPDMAQVGPKIPQRVPRKPQKGQGQAKIGQDYPRTAKNGSNIVPNALKMSESYQIVGRPEAMG